MSASTGVALSGRFERSAGAVDLGGVLREIDDARALVFREHALQLQQQGVLRRLPNRAVKEHDLGAGARELLDQHRLMRV